MYFGIAVIAVFTFAYGLLSERISRLPTSGPLVFVVAGVGLGRWALDGSTTIWRAEIFAHWLI